MKLDDYKNRNPFKVPEGYFDNLASNIVQQLPKEPCEQKKRKTISLTRHLRHIGYAATIAVILFLGATAIVKTTGESTNIAASNNEYYNNEYIDELLENYTFDDYTFYCYITDNN